MAFYKEYEAGTKQWRMFQMFLRDQLQRGEGRERFARILAEEEARLTNDQKEMLDRALEEERKHAIA